MNSKEVFSLYESIRPLLPTSNTTKTPLHVKNSKELAQCAECFFLDAYGVLNVGTKAIKGAKEFLDLLRLNNTPFLVLTNSATIPKTAVHKRLNNMGFNLNLDDIISSREVMFSKLKSNSLKIGVISHTRYLEQPLNATFLEEEGFWESEGFLFLSTLKWNDKLQIKWKEELAKKPRPVWVANPDMTSPIDNGQFSKQPGFYTLLEPQNLFSKCTYVGKPFNDVFVHALRIAKQRWDIKADEVMMLGDTLHTDILGANSMGMKSALIENYGFFKGLDCKKFIEKSKIYPDVILTSYS